MYVITSFHIHVYIYTYTDEYIYTDIYIGSVYKLSQTPFLAETALLKLKEKSVIIKCQNEGL